MLKLAVDLTIKIHHEECGLSEERNALSKDEIKERVKEALETYLFDAGDVKKLEIDNLLIIKETEERRQ